MKTLRSFLRLALPGLCTLAGLTGCSSIGSLGSLSAESLRPDRYFDEQSFTYDQPTVHAACKQALEDMRYAVDRSSVADGTIQATSRINPGNQVLTDRQRQAIVLVQPTTEGSYARVGFSETTEERSPSGNVMPTSRLLKVQSLYEAFWKRVDDLLKAGSGEVKPAEDTSADG